MRRALLACSLVLAMPAGALPAGAQDAPVAAAPASPANPAFDLARQAAAARPPAEIAAIQRALIWTGDLNTMASGEFGKRTFDGIRAFQKRLRAKDTGILLPAEQDALARAAAKALAGFGFRTITEQGVTLGYPARLAAIRTEGTRGPKYASASGNVTVDILRYPAGEEDFEAIFARLRTERAGRKIVYSLLRPDFFVITGTVDGKSFYMRFLRAPDGTRGFSVGWDPALSPGFDRVPIAMAVSLRLEGAPDPATPAPGAEASTTSPPAGPPASSGPAVPLAAGASRGAKRGTAFAVSKKGHFLTTASLVAGCSEVSMPGGGKGTVLAGDVTNDVALVKASGGPGPAALRLSPLLAGEAVTILATAGGQPSRTSASVAALSAQGGDTRRFTTSQPGQGAAFDAAGALVGLYPAAASPDALKALFVSAFLRANGVAPATDAGMDPAGSMTEMTCDPGSP